MSSIPRTLWFDILTRVPVEKTFVCKCVCKFMCDIISDIDFARMHKCRAIQKNNLNFLYFTLERNGSMLSGFSVSRTIFSVTHDSVLTSASIPEYTIVSDVPYKNLDFYITMLGSSKGLVCLLYYNIPSQYFVCLWNPSTTEYMKLPELHALKEYNYLDIRTHSLGYDRKTDNFKLVISESMCAQGDGSAFRIFRLREKSWSTQSVQYDITDASRGEMFLNGAFHWAYNMFGQDSQFVLSWDINKEVFKEMHLPNKSWGEGHVLIDIRVMDLDLCVMLQVPTSLIEVWVMQEYGSAESWCLRYIITHKTLVDYPCLKGWDECLFPLKMACIFKSGEILFWVPGESLLYDPKHQKLTNKNAGACHLLTRGLSNYLDTLVSLGSDIFVRKRV
ncbi:F-box/kelch-repeat protein At3g06240-like [Papaver somniferum]|uniref:F-box/kelch-repeat protein At3g06240-like n=1 Tax=Papaver somniferum TaxID=3469 RepID=UPI000E6FE584|nr:F-box/kelch-repeat protein At3g06240-like [Papaver somniferum]